SSRRRRRARSARLSPTSSRASWDTARAKSSASRGSCSTRPTRNSRAQAGCAGSPAARRSSSARASGGDDMGGFALRPDKLLKGAFVEYGLSLPPIAFTFQFNPESLSRGRTASYTSPGADGDSGTGCREGSEAQQRSCLAQVTVSEETIGLTLQLDATDD